MRAIGDRAWRKRVFPAKRNDLLIYYTDVLHGAKPRPDWWYDIVWPIDTGAKEGGYKLVFFPTLGWLTACFDLMDAKWKILGKELSDQSPTHYKCLPENPE